ncbi:MAG: prepilin peptidase [Candidatus Pacearchaeota archaeon]|jgi:Flp pilus assembly protein protease CpaA
MVNEILGPENWFLIFLGLVWIIGAVLQDLRRREVDNLWNFSLIPIAIIYRLLVYIFNGNYWFVLNGLIGLAIFFVLHNLFYYSRMFAGGDAKLLLALGIILPLSYNWIINLKIFGIFILLFLAGGSIYSLIWAFCLMIKHWKHFKKEFVKQWKNYQKIFLFDLIFVILWVAFSFIISRVVFILIGMIVLLFPVLFIFAKSIEESCMVVELSPDKVTEGDWLYEDIFVGGKKIKSNWEGVSTKELALIRNKCKKKILIKFGIPFTPAFLFGMIGLLYLAWSYGMFF